MNARNYRIELTPSAERDLRDLPSDVRQRLVPRIDALARTPRPAGVKKLSGEEDLYRIRVADYRIIYQIRDRALLILVVRLGHRRGVYR